MNTSKLEVLSGWISDSTRSIRKAEVKELQDYDPFELGYVTIQTLKESMVSGGNLINTFSSIGQNVTIGDTYIADTRERNSKHSKIGHFLLHLLVENGKIDFVQQDSKFMKSFKEGKWRVFNSKDGNFVVKPNQKHVKDPYEVVILDEDWMDEIFAEVDNRMEEVPTYNAPLFEEPDGFEGFYHPEAGQLVRNANRSIRRTFDLNPNHKAIKIINKQIKTPYNINVDLLDLYKKNWRDNKLFNFSNKKMTNKQKKSKLHEMKSVMRMADTIGYRDFWTYKFYCFRYRMYSSSSFLKHDGGKLSKSLIEMANKEAIGTEGLFWLHIHAANCWGEDKLSLDGRHDFAIENMDKWMMWAKEAVQNGIWIEEAKDADDPFGFMGVIMELYKASLLNDPTKFESGLLVGIDASCSGLQILSALSKDEVSGRLCNLTGDTRGDFYGHISDVEWKKMRFSKADVEIYNKVIEKLKDKTDYFDFNTLSAEVSAELEIANRVFWGRLRHLKRKICKRPCMTYFYSCKPETMANALYNDFKTEEGFEDLNPVFCYILSKGIYNTCRTEMARPTKLMDIFIELGNRDRKAGEHFTASTVYTNAPMSQNYTGHTTKPFWFRNKDNRFRLRMITEYSKNINHHKVKSATSPNVVHMLDSQLVAGIIDYCEYEVSCIHDCFASIPSNVGKLYEDTREVFVKMFNNGTFKTMLEEKDAIDLYNTVEFGTLDINDVLDQEWFTS